MTKLIVSNYGPGAKELLVVLLDEHCMPKMDAVVRRVSMLKRTVEQIVLEPGHALVILPKNRKSQSDERGKVSCEITD